LHFYQHFFFLTALVFAQAPEKFNYQAVVRDNAGNIIANQAVSFRISVLQGSVYGASVYVETQKDTTNSYGVSVLKIGAGVPLYGTMAGITWANGPYYIKVEFDQNGGTSYITMGTTQLLSVPYALHSRTADSVCGLPPETDPVFGVSPAGGITGTNIINWNTAYGWGNHADAGYLTTEADGSATNELQVLSISNDTVYLSNGGFVNLASYHDTLWAISGNNIYNSNNGNVGIGTAAPVKKLDVAGGAIQTDNQLISTVATGTAPLAVSSTTLVSGLNSDLLDGYHYDNLPYAPFSGSVNYIQHQIATDQAAGFRISGNGLFNGGNVGIGTITPLAKLQVAGGAIMPAIGNSASTGICFPSNPGGGVSDEAFIKYYVKSGEATRLLIGNNNDGDDDIGFYQSGAERMTIAGGNVGIGTESPVQKLDVDGTVKATNFSGDGSLVTNVTALTVVDGAITTPKLYDGAVTLIKMAGNAVNSSTIVNGSIGYLDVNTNELQRRVGSPCPAGSSIRAINSDGSVICEPDDNIMYNNGTGISLTGTTFSLIIPVAVSNGGTGQNSSLTQGGVVYAASPTAMATTAAGNSGQILKSNGTGAPTWVSNNGLIVTAETGSTIPLTSSWSNYSGAAVTITAPYSGTIEVLANVWVRFDHTLGTADILYLGIGTSPTDGGTAYNYVVYDIPSVIPTYTSSANNTFTVTRRFSVTAGTYTYYLNGYMSSGLANDYFWYASMRAVFY